MAGNWDGTLTAAEFEAAALHLVEVWKSQCPQLPAWTWHVYEPPLKSPVLASSAVGYLVLQDVHILSEQKVVAEVEDIHEVDDESQDIATLEMSPGLPGYEEHVYSYHVIYNESYRVPMIFLQGHFLDGTPLQWHHVCHDLPLDSQQISHESRWTFLTQEEHPFLHRPWFALHPCGTSSIMSLVFASPLSNAAKDSSNDNRIQDTRNFLPSSDQVNILPSPNQVSVLQPPYNEISALSSKPQKSSRCQEKHRIDLMKQYILTWLSFACPTVGLTIPSCVFKATN